MNEAAHEAKLRDYQARVERALEARLPPESAVPARLHAAMRYSALGGGKRVRPALVYATGEMLGVPAAALDAAAAAVEMIHVYSLIHDDLPAMDDDDLRRGRPTCHKAFDEGTAVLVGDALQALAFEVLAGDSASPLPAASRLQQIQVLSRAIGTDGMAGGQAIDLAAVGKVLDPRTLEDMHRRKTGALLRASVLLGAIGGGVTEGPRYEALWRYGTDLGLAFQIQDDVLDVLGETATLGKVAGADAARGKPTYPSILGLAESQRLARLHCDRAIESLASLGPSAGPLAQLADYVVNRSH